MRLLIAFAVLCGTLCGAPPMRIISTAPGITEILFALGLGDRVVGATDGAGTEGRERQGTDDPEVAGRAPGAA